MDSHDAPGSHPHTQAPPARLAYYPVPPDRRRGSRFHWSGVIVVVVILVVAALVGAFFLIAW
jgi:hypothetical protein